MSDPENRILNMKAEHRASFVNPASFYCIPKTRLMALEIGNIYRVFLSGLKCSLGTAEVPFGTHQSLRHNA